MRPLLTVFPAAEQTMFRRCAYRKIDQLTPIVSETEQIRNCGNSLLKQLIESDKDLFGDGSLVALSTPGHTSGHQSLLVHLEKTGYVVRSVSMRNASTHWFRTPRSSRGCSTIPSARS